MKVVNKMEITHEWTNGKNGAPKDAKYIREAVFMKEQGFKNEFDELDTICEHLVLYNHGKPVGVARIFTEDGGKIYHIGRVAIMKELRGTGLGSVVMRLATQKIKELGGKKATLSAQVSASKFYETLGFCCEGEQYFDEYCPHICMNKEIL